MVGLSTIGSIAFGIAFVAGKKRVPNPTAGMIAFLTFFILYKPHNNHIIYRKSALGELSN